MDNIKNNCADFTTKPEVQSRYVSSKKNLVFDNLISLLSSSATTDIITPADSRYEKARLIYNRMHDYYPGLIVRTLDIDALRTIITFAVQHNIVLAIRGGGHHIGGFGTCHHGIVVDFSTFKSISINHVKNIVSVDPGVCLGDLDSALSAAGYIVPTGTVSETGVAGLTLGGGIGWLIGQYSLTCDNLCGADVLLADGRLVQAEDPEHKELLWALRGGGGNFGMVLNFRYKLHAMPKTICGMGLVAWENIMPVMNVLLPYMHTQCPAAMTIAPIFIKDSTGRPNMRIDFCCANGTDDDVSKLISLSKLITWSMVKEWEFSAWQKEFDQAFLPPMRGYWKAAYLDVLTPEIISLLSAAFLLTTNHRCSILIEHLHGAFKNYDQSTSAFPLRKNNFGILFSMRWEDAYDDIENINWVRQSFDSLDPAGTSNTYSNYTFAEDMRAVTTLLSSATSHIAKVKEHYDPNNTFRCNHNVAPGK